MPFTKTFQVLDQFVKEFTKESTSKPISGEGARLFPFIPIEDPTGNSVDFLVRYYKRSGESAVEDVREFYPCIIIQDFAPKINSAIQWGKDYVEGVYDEVKKQREYVYLPIPMMFQFQVACVTKRKKESKGAEDWFLGKFQYGTAKFFEFNKIVSPEGFVADIVPYSVDSTEVEREDGRFETIYDFTLETFIHARAKSYIFVNEQEGFSGGNFSDTLEKLTVALSMGNIKDLETVLQYEFEV